MGDWTLLALAFWTFLALESAMPPSKLALGRGGPFAWPGATRRSHGQIERKTKIKNGTWVVAVGWGCGLGAVGWVLGRLGAHMRILPVREVA